LYRKGVKKSVGLLVELSSTHNKEGRGLLLKARALAFSSEFVSEAERLDQ